MLNEKVDFQFLQQFVVVCCILFLIVLWGSFYFFTRFKKKDDAYRHRFVDMHATDPETEQQH
ncbi:MAG: hypothetical protein JST12_06080 [Armatimonadetes bacterium]|nr:hypothetical protein [Armatimonadota bacterium]